MVNGPTGSGQELTFNQAVIGAGSTTGNVEYAASYRPSNSPDAVSVQNVLLDSTSTLILELGGPTAGSGYDQLDISGLATLNGTLDVELLNGFSPSAGKSFDVLSGRTTGSFARINVPALGNGLQLEHEQRLHDRDDHCNAGAFDARPARCRRHRIARLQLATPTRSETNCEASGLRPAARGRSTDSVHLRGVFPSTRLGAARSLI